MLFFWSLYLSKNHEKYNFNKDIKEHSWTEFYINNNRECFLRNQHIIKCILYITAILLFYSIFIPKKSNFDMRHLSKTFF